MLDPWSSDYSLASPMGQLKIIWLPEAAHYTLAGHFGPAKDTLAARGRPYLVVAYGHNLIKSFDSNGRIRTRSGVVNGIMNY